MKSSPPLIKAFILSLCFLTFGLSASSQSQEQVYAGVILHIMKYVEWPEYDEDMSIGVVNSPALVRALQKASAGKKVHFKNVTVVRFDDISALKDVDVLFFTKKVLNELPAGLEKTAGANVLVITEEDSKMSKGVAVNFVQVNGRLQFELYDQAISSQGFKVSDQLKKLAILK